MRGGIDDDDLHGNDGIDQLYGDAGRDYLFGDAGAPDGTQAGQRLWGGDGIDFLHAYAALTINAPAAQLAAEVLRAGDELHGGAGGDFVYGNLRKDFLFGDDGKDFLHGDFLSGPGYAVNARPATTGGADQLSVTAARMTCSARRRDQLWGGADSTGSKGRTAATSCSAAVASMCSCST
jgi:hypothetical protein